MLTLRDTSVVVAERPLQTTSVPGIFLGGVAILAESFDGTLLPSVSSASSSSSSLESVMLLSLSVSLSVLVAGLGSGDTEVDFWGVAFLGGCSACAVIVIVLPSNVCSPNAFSAAFGGLYEWP